MRLSTIILLMTTLMLAPGAVRAQNAPPDLVVTLRDVQNQGVVGATISVRDAADGQEIARSTTDGQGQATFVALRVADLRVAVHGQLSSGARLYLPGQDASGIRLTLGVPPIRLDLRVEPNGLIRPDPETMIVPEIVGDLAGTVGPLAAYHPEAPIATPPPIGRMPPFHTAIPPVGVLRVPLASVPLAPDSSSAAAETAGTTPVASGGTTVPAWMGALAIGLLVLASLGLLWLARKEWRVGR
jgi:hypothetical protein